MASKQLIQSPFLASREAASLIVHLFREGETERQYLQDISDGSSVRVIPQLRNSDPQNLIDKAVTFLNAHEVDFRNNSALEIWVVFDDDEKPEIQIVMKKFPTVLNRIKNAALQSRIHVGFMKPCIELWAVMCLPSGLREFNKAKGHRKMESLLRRLMPSYRHDGNPYFDVSKMTEWLAACKRAAKWEQTWQPFPHCTSATWFAGIYTLVNRIQTTKQLSASGVVANSAIRQTS